jgi:xylulokinase
VGKQNFCLDKYLLAYDIGTNGVKAALFTPKGQQSAFAYQEYGVDYPHPGWVEQSVQLLWDAQCAVTRQLITNVGCNPKDIAAVAVSSQRATFVPLNKSRQPIGNFIGWQDTRSTKQCNWARKNIGEQRYYDISGLPISPTAAVSKILWIKENDPALFDKTATFATTQCVHLEQLGVGNAPSDMADGGYTGLMDVNALNWSRELLSAFDIPEEKMPMLVNSGIQVGEISREAAEKIGLTTGTPVVTAGGDLQCAGAGLGIVRPGTISVGIGSGGGILIYLEEPLRHPKIGLNCQPHVVHGGWEMEGICLASGASFKWYRDTLSQTEKNSAVQQGLDPYDLLCEDSAGSQPGAGGLLFMPSLAGSGAPCWLPQTRGAFIGITLSTTKCDMNRAVLEGICLEIRAMIEAAQQIGVEIDELRIWGGGAKSPLWNQISADVYGLPVVKTAIREGGLAGAAICAGVGIGLYRDIAEGAELFVRTTDRFDPDPNLRNLYDELFGLYQTTYQALLDANTFTRLGDLGDEKKGTGK